MNVTDVEFDEFLVWNKFFKPKDVLTIIDVGANLGQSVDLYLENFPDSEIYCFAGSPNSLTA